MNDRFHEFEDGLAHLAAGRGESALKSLRAAAQREPGRLAVVRGLATACLLVGDVVGAREVVRGLTMNSPMCAEGWRLAAQLEWKLGKYDDAMAVLARGAEHLPHSVVLQKQIAVFWGARGRVASSESSQTRLATRPCSLQASEPAKLEDWLDQVARDSKLLESVLNSPQSESDQAMLKALEFKLSTLLESQPYHADRQLGLARLQVKIGTLPAAILSVQRALRANPNYVEAHRLRATILGKMGEYDAAIQVLEGLIGRGMDWADIHYQLAEMQNARGRSEEARSHLYSAIRLNPRFEQAKQLLERVAA